MIQKRSCINNKSSKLKMLVYGAWDAWSRPNLVGAGVGSGISDFRSRSRPKRWRLRNTALNEVLEEQSKAKH